MIRVSSGSRTEFFARSPRRRVQLPRATGWMTGRAGRLARSSGGEWQISKPRLGNNNLISGKYMLSPRKLMFIIDCLLLFLFVSVTKLYVDVVVPTVGSPQAKQRWQ